MRARYSRVVRVAVGAAMRGVGAENVAGVFGGQRRHVDHFEARGVIAQQPQRARDVAAGQHEAVAARGQTVDAVRAARGAGPGKLSNVRSSRNSSSRNVAGSLAAVRARCEESERRVEGGARAAGPRGRASVTGNGETAVTA